MKKKIVSFCMVVSMVLIAIGGATMAYFTDDDQKTNNFTIGDISIEVKEDDGTYGTYVYDPTADTIVEDASETQYDEEGNVTGVKFMNLMPSYIISKRPYVENTSENDAYVRIALTLNNASAINDAIDEVYEEKFETQFRTENPTISDEDLDAKVDAEVQKIYDEVFFGWGLNHLHEGEDSNGRRMTMKQRSDCYHVDSAFLMTGGDYQFNRSNQFQADVEKQDCTITSYQNDGVLDGYNGQSITDGYYYNALNRDERVYVFYVRLGAGEKYFLFNQALNGVRDGGLNIPAEFNNDQMKMFDGLKIGIYADAIQTVGFTDNEEGALKAFETLNEEHPIGWWND